MPARARTLPSERSLDYVPARVEREHSLPGGEGLDRLAAAVFGGAGPAGPARLAPLIERFDEEVGKLAVDDEDFELLSVGRMDWALCDVSSLGVPVASRAGRARDSWAWRAVHGELPGYPQLAGRPELRAAACSITGLFEVFPGEPTWVRDRLSGVVLRVRESVGPWPRGGSGAEGPAALWELRLVPCLDPSCEAEASTESESASENPLRFTGEFALARPPLDYPLELLEVLEDHHARRFRDPPWPTMQDLRRARLRHVRAGRRTPISRMLMWR